MTETWNAADEEYGEQRLMDLLVGLRDRDASGLQTRDPGRTGVVPAGAKATDDRTLIVVKREA